MRSTRRVKLGAVVIERVAHSLDTVIVQLQTKVDALDKLRLWLCLLYTSDAADDTINV